MTIGPAPMIMIFDRSFRLGMVWFSVLRVKISES